ncbi:uncharacterized protein LAESUDRAFT_812385 [Laetiporus sulphureus 93-53]|uniref:Yeast cell wall synthesis Kre9/Knh1-like N-terminal domain-containing protein n=1 Tax=Laetiporus sulphureus 93-53 TaxID=1314785 RepID=A0A165EH51_9APHY|nr:uncharacterized protein LAESUDRAFT_812385 [Laetiporus sulphureus 93-53]KZT07043.1 hypothetical protein LAESUDRAFT_812385 [Laetiporus sulphureus 93-53]
MLFRTFTIASLVSFASALILQTPTEWVSDAPANISWESQPDDPSTFALVLTNLNDPSHISYALASPIQTSAGFSSFEVPTVPTGSGYVVSAVNATNNDEVYAQSGEFAIVRF